MFGNAKPNVVYLEDGWTVHELEASLRIGGRRSNPKKGVHIVFKGRARRPPRKPRKPRKPRM